MRAIFSLIQQGVENDELVKRKRVDLEKIVSDYFVFEVDRDTVACAALHVYPEQNMGELASLFVNDRYENQDRRQAHPLCRESSPLEGIGEAVLPFDGRAGTSSGGSRWERRRIRRRLAARNTTRAAANRPSW
ncbi:MAG: hypothetical protein U0792_13975 [Gemmataceae bacterium]